MNELHELHDLFAASVGAAAALIGLLFVAVSVDPEKIFGANADLVRRSNAERAFTALANVFFVSLAALLTHSVPAVVTVMAVVAMVQTIQTGRRIYRLGDGWQNWRQFGIISLCVYVFELFAALSLSNMDASADRIVYIVLALYAYALGTSWGLLGARADR